MRNHYSDWHIICLYAHSVYGIRELESCSPLTILYTVAVADSRMDQAERFLLSPMVLWEQVWRTGLIVFLPSWTDLWTRCWVSTYQLPHSGHATGTNYGRQTTPSCHGRPLVTWTLSRMKILKVQDLWRFSEILPHWLVPKVSCWYIYVANDFAKELINVEFTFDLPFELLYKESVPCSPHYFCNYIHTVLQELELKCL